MDSTDPTLQAEDRAEILRLLQDSAVEFLTLVSELDGERWSRAPAPDFWSVKDIAEHLVLGERAMLGKIAEAMANPPNPDWESQDRPKTEFLSRILPKPIRKASAPEPLMPHHNWSREETISRFKAGRARTLQLARDLEGAAKAHCADHPFPVFNSLSAYHWLLYIPLHNSRHNRQIAVALGKTLAVSGA